MFPALGVGEELGELIFAEDKDDIALGIDAMADIGIYLTDVCNRLGIKMQTLRFNSRKPHDPGRFYLAFSYQLGKLNHAVLKSAQKIRMDEDHAKTAYLAIQGMFDCLQMHAAEKYKRDLLTEIIYPEWEKVRERDWTKERPAEETAKVT